MVVRDKLDHKSRAVVMNNAAMANFAGGRPGRRGSCAIIVADLTFNFKIYQRTSLMLRTVEAKDEGLNRPPNTKVR